MQSEARLVPLIGESGRPLSPTEVGNKASTLSRLLVKGFPVPNGFCIPAAVLSKLAERSSVTSVSVPYGETARRLRAGLMQDLTLRKLLHQYSKKFLRGSLSGTLAVRSSATVEDSSRASFAGQFRSVLGVTVEDVEEAVLACWLSLWEANVFMYARAMGIALDVTSFAVLIQSQILPDFAGVAFSVNPVTGDTNEVLIEGASGPGELVTSGETVPSRAVVAKASGSLLERHASDTEALLPEALCRNVASLCCRVEETFGVPQDIEWALDKARLWLIQSRPVTTLERKGLTFDG